MLGARIQAGFRGFVTREGVATLLNRIEGLVLTETRQGILGQGEVTLSNLAKTSSYGLGELVRAVLDAGVPVMVLVQDEAGLRRFGFRRADVLKAIGG